MEYNESLLIHRANDVKLATDAKRKQWVTLHCERCRTVLGDSLTVCGEIMDSIMCTDFSLSQHNDNRGVCAGLRADVPERRPYCVGPDPVSDWTDTRRRAFGYAGPLVIIGVTNDVIISDEMQSGHEGRMTDCIYSPLRCRGCCCAVGKIIHSAPPHLAVIRSMFLLHKANISCYILNSCSMVNASTLIFDVKPLKESIHEVRRQCEAQFEARFNQMLCIKSRLAGRRVTRELDK